MSNFERSLEAVVQDERKRESEGEGGRGEKDKYGGRERVDNTRLFVIHGETKT